MTHAYISWITVYVSTHLLVKINGVQRFQLLNYKLAPPPHQKTANHILHRLKKIKRTKREGAFSNPTQMRHLAIKHSGHSANLFNGKKLLKAKWHSALVYHSY